MDRLFTTHRVLYYLYKYTSEKNANWRTATIFFLLRLMELCEKNYAISANFPKSVGLDIFFKDKHVCYIRFNKNSFSVYIHQNYLLSKVAGKIFNTPFNSKWYLSYHIHTKKEIDGILNYLSKFKVPKEANEKTKTRNIPQWVKKFVYERDNGRCVACGSKVDLCYDHIIPYAKGGSSINPQNVQLLCSKCNLRKKESFLY